MELRGCERSTTVNMRRHPPQTSKCGRIVKARPHSVLVILEDQPSAPTDPLVEAVCAELRALGAHVERVRE